MGQNPKRAQVPRCTKVDQYTQLKDLSEDILSHVAVGILCCRPCSLGSTHCHPPGARVALHFHPGPTTRRDDGAGPASRAWTRGSLRSARATGRDRCRRKQAPKSPKDQFRPSNSGSTYEQLWVRCRHMNIGGAAMFQYFGA